MCASYEARFNITQLVELFGKARAPLDMTTGLPNLAPGDEVKPTDVSPVVGGTAGSARLAMLKFGFPPPRPKARPVVNLRAEGRVFDNRERTGRCLVPVSGFYEFTGDRYPKTRWVFRDAEAPFLALAGIWRAGEAGEGASFALLTTERGPDVAPYHNRGVIPVLSERWADWLFAESFPADVIAPPAAGRMTVAAFPRPPKI